MKMCYIQEMSTKHNICFRTFQNKDSATCKEMMTKTWQYEKYFTTMKKPMYLYTFMLNVNLLDGDYAEVAVLNGDVVGFLIGQTKDVKGKTLQKVFLYLKVFIQWLLGCYGNRSIALQVYKDYKKDGIELFKDFTSKDAHIHLFFTGEKARGLGIGKQLLSRFEDYCKSQKNDTMVLVTDTDCNYGFYDHVGFERVKEKKGCYGVPLTNDNKDAITFVYAKKII